MLRNQLALQLVWLPAFALVTACSGSDNTSGSGGGGAGGGASTSHGSSMSHGTSSANGGGSGTSTASANGGGSGAGTQSGSGGTKMVIMPGDPGMSDVTFAIDSTQPRHAISPYIYGTNSGDLTAEAKGLTMTRVGGNRLTAYNWETNASNAGSDYLYENDDFMSSSNVAGKPMKDAVTAAHTSNASIIMTVPIAGWVSADESGPCNPMPTQAQIAQHFFPIEAKKGSAFVYPPDLTDDKVYADEFVSWLESQFPQAQTDPSRRIFYMLDNEPDLWSSTHSEIHPAQLTYAEIFQKNTDFAKGIKDVAPNAIVFGPVNYGWEGYVNLQNAPDAMGRDFIETWLDSMSAADASAGKRLVDVLDVHWYPEATGDGNRITDDGTSAGEVQARVQAPRSLWDTTYTETSWITQDSTMGPINLIPRMKQKITAHYPGTKLSMSEYNYGAGGDISGGIAQADVLGIFGSYDMFAASTWILSQTNTFLFAGFAMYRNYDGQGATFGDTSIVLTDSHTDTTSGYASVSSNDDTNVIVVAINKQSMAMVAGITITHTAHLGKADVYTLTSAAASPQKGTGLTEVATNAFSYSMPPMSVTTLVFHP